MTAPTHSAAAPRPRRLVILVCGTTNETIREARGDFAEWIRTTVGATWNGEWAEHDLRSPDPFPDPRGAAGFVITGSSSSVTERAPWMLRAEGFIRAIVAAETPLFGICFGHQIMAQALGGEVTKNPRGREIGTAKVQASRKDPLFDGIDALFEVQATHVDTVFRIPEGATLLATSQLDGAAALAFGDRARSVQFHPEIDHDIIRRYIAVRAPLIRSEGLDPDALHAAVSENVAGAEVLRNFIRRFVESG